MDALENLQASRYLSIAGLVMLLYDHILSFSDEVELIWKARWTTPKTLFLILRYFVPPFLIVHLHQLSGISAAGLSDMLYVEIHFYDLIFFLVSFVSSCKVWFAVSGTFGIMTMGIASFLVLLHLWNLWQRDKRLIYITCVLYFLTQIGQLICAGFITSSFIKNLTYDRDIRSCSVANRAGFYLLWAPGLILDAVICALVAYTSLKRTSRDVMTGVVSTVFYRDGLFVYLILVSLRCINLILAVKAPISLIFLPVFFTWAANVTAINRMILRLRRLSVRRSSRDQDDDHGCSSLEVFGEVVNDGTGNHQ
ncbi:hypothetical protein L218DRAFT_1078234 [Marasmius fiardii PR-910]|nr:hypothetical protein L218DRAFT_1078234 [Marasmius fiardii PR-910]